MRAGSLSDERAVALLTEHFVVVHVPELCTKELIADPEDLRLMQHYDELTRARGTKGLHGGVLEMFLAPDGELLDAFAMLDARKAPDANGASRRLPAQYTHEAREDRDGHVLVWLERARRCLERVHGQAPEDFAGFVDGTAPQVAAVREAVPEPPSLPEGQSGLRIRVRNSWNMYDSLVGCELLPLDAEQQRALWPEDVAVGATRRWPVELVREIGRRAAPRGLAWTRLADASISGHIDAEVVAVSSGAVRVQLAGELVLAPQDLDEVTPRRAAASLYTSRSRLVGELVVDAASGRVSSLRLASRDGEFTIQPRNGGPHRWPGQVHRFAIEWVRGSP